MPAGPRRSLMFNLGAFFGNIARTVKSADASDRKVVRQDVHEETRDTPHGKVTLRRTTIEEIEVHPPLPPPPPTPSGQQAPPPPHHPQQGE